MERQHFVDCALPFSLRSAPKIFNTIADLIAWFLTCQGVQFQLHYLDDFLLLGSPNSQQGREFLTIPEQSLTRLRILITAHKTEGPATTLTFLGILVDSDKFELSLHLPADKLARLQDALQQCRIGMAPPFPSHGHICRGILGCIWFIWLWGICVFTWLVPAAMASGLACF